MPDIACGVLAAGEQATLTSDTGQLKRDWQQGLLVIDTPRSRGAVGWLGEAGRTELADCAIQADTPKAAVILSSLDGQPLARSSRILVSAVARVTTRREKGRTVALSEPVAGMIVLRNQNRGLVLVPLSTDGERGTPLAGVRKGQEITFQLPTDHNTHWFEIRPAP